ncbi:MAG: serine hydrolase domain-containing protein, partial [Bacteroidota bacterium]
MFRIKIILAWAGIGLLGYGLWYGYGAMSIISSYGAKNLCSCVFVTGREPEQVIAEELGTTLSALGTYEINRSDSSAEGSVFGLARHRAIFRKGLGCTLVNGISEEALRNQPFIGESPIPSNDSLPWPQGDRIATSIPANIDTALLNTAIRQAFNETNPDQLQRTRAVVVVYRDTIIAERYAAGFTKYTPLMGWSMTKSLTNALVGILVGDGKLDVNAPATVPDWHQKKNDPRKTITLNHLMHASSGLDWDEFYGGPSDATRMLFLEPDAGAVAAAKASETKPDEVFEYSSGTTNIISGIVRRTIGDTGYHRFPYDRLFRKIGMNGMIMEPDPSGTFVGSSYSYAPARDWARFGLLYLHDGVWQGRRILPEGWVSYTSTPAPAALRGEYGAQ